MMRTETVGTSAPSTLGGALVVIAAVRAARDKAVDDLKSARAEVDEQETLVRRTSELNAALAKQSETLRSQRDDYREAVDEERERADRFAATIDELEAEVTDLRRGVVRHQVVSL